LIKLTVMMRSQRRNSRIKAKSMKANWQIKESKKRPKKRPKSINKRVS